MHRTYAVNADYVLNKDRNDIHLNDVRLQFDTVTYTSMGPSLIHFGPAGVDIDSLDLRTPSGRRVYVDGRSSDPGRCRTFV